MNLKKKIENLLYRIEWAWNPRPGSMALRRFNDFIIMDIFYRNEPLEFWHKRIEKAAKNCDGMSLKELWDEIDASEMGNKK